MKMREVIANEKCYTKDMYSCFSERKEKNYYNGIVLRELFKKHGINYNNADVMKIVKDVMPIDLFQISREETINTTLLVLRLLRVQQYFNKYVVTPNMIIHNGGIRFVTNHKIEVDYNLVIEDGNSVTIVKIKNKKCDLSKAGKSVHTKISDNMELFLLQLAAEDMFPNKLHHQAQIIYLRHKDDKNDTLIPVSDYANDTKKSIVTASFIGSKSAEMMQRVDDAIAGKSKHSCNDCFNCAYNSLCTYKKDNTNLLVIPQKAKASGKVTFTQSQQNLIDAKGGIFRVLAVAGSGKTTCIANRICNLVKNGCNPKDILLITYTTKAVDEMREKIEYWLKVNKVKANISDFQIFTFNSFGFELIKKEYTKFGYTTEPGLLEKSEKIALIKSILDAKPEIDGFNYKDPILNMPYAKGVVLVMDEYFTKIKNSGCTYAEEVQNVCGIKDVKIAKQVMEMYLEYINHMKVNNLVDYMDQVNLCYEILREPNNLKKYGYSHVMVDEFQDSDTLQINILMLLTQHKYFQSLMVVGDDSQAIYSWRGATAHNIINFKDIFPNTVDIPLLENFRSTKEICALANAINDINKDKIPKNLISTKSGNSPSLFCLSSVEAFIDKMMEAIMYYGMEFSDVALIARNKKELLQMQQLLIARNVPCVLSVSELLVDNPVVQHLINFAKFLQDLSSDLYFAEFLQVYDGDNFEKQTKATLKGYVQSNLDVFTQELIACNTEEEKIQLVYSKFEKIAQEERSVKSLLDILKSKKFLTLYDMGQFLIDMQTYKADYSIDKIDSPVNAITLTTAHSSKGREWKTVGIYLDTFSYPSQYDYAMVKNNPSFEEERRLLFVAITRAKEFLFLAGNSSESSYTEVAKALKIK